MVAGLFGRDHLAFSRYGLTHSLLGVAVSSLALAGAARWWCPARFTVLASLALLAQAIHVLMDLSGAGGVGLLEPFSPERFGLSWTPAVDPIGWSILAIGLAVGILAGTRGPVVNGFALGALLAYYLACGSGHAMAIAQFREAMTWLRVDPGRAAAFPQPGGPLRWSVVGTEDDRYYHAYVHALKGLHGRIRVFFRQPLPPALDGEFAARYRDWAAAPLVRPFAAAERGSYAVCDLRFLGTRKLMPGVARLYPGIAGEPVREWLPEKVTPPEPDQEYELPTGP